MLEVIAWAPDLATLKKAAKSTGFVDQVVDEKTKKVVSESIKTNGSWAGSHGGWALAICPQFNQLTGKMVTVDGPGGTMDVPEMAPVAGVWARLRWNDMALLDRLEKFIAAVEAEGVTVYRLVNIGTEEAPEFVWSPDGGKTTAPAYLDQIGVML